jgi:hypothetical protein
LGCEQFVLRYHCAGGLIQHTWVVIQHACYVIQRADPFIRHEGVVKKQVGAVIQHAGVVKKQTGVGNQQISVVTASLIQSLHPPILRNCIRGKWVIKLLNY